MDEDGTDGGRPSPWYVPPSAPLPPLGSPRPGWGPPGPPGPPITPIPPIPLGPPGPPSGPVTPSGPTLVPLRPLQLGNLLAGGARALRYRPLLLLSLGVLAAVVNVLIRLVLGPTATYSHDANGALHNHQHPAAIAAGYLGSLVSYPVIAVITLVTLALAAGQPTPPGLAWIGLRKLPGLALIAFIRVLVFVVLGLVGVGVWLYLRWALAPSIYVSEDVSVGAAFRRSQRLVDGSWWRTLAVLAVTGVVTATPGAVLGLVFAFRTHAGSGELPTLGEFLVLTALTIPAQVFGTAVASLLLLDQRCRREGLAWGLQRARSHPGLTLTGPDGVYATPHDWQTRPGGPT